MLATLARRVTRPLLLTGASPLLLLSLLSSAPLHADRVITEDGRVLEVKKARAQDGGYLLVFENGEIVLADKKGVKAVEIEGDMADYVPKDDDEKEKLAQGYVRRDGRWLSKPQYEEALRVEHEKSLARANDLAAHADFNSGWTKETKHFVFTTNTSPELLDYYADLLEAYYSLMDDRFGIKPSPTLKRMKMPVNIYKNRREFTKLTGMPSGVAGFFRPDTKDLNFYHDYQEHAISDWVSLHESTHLLTFLIDPQYAPQIWLNEAVADYFGSADITRDKKGKLEIHPGRLQTDRVLTVQQAIKEGNDIKLEKLFKIDRANFQSFEYAHAWSFIYFLNESNAKYKKGFDKFFEDIYTLAKGIRFETAAGWDKSGVAKRVPADEIRRVVLESLGVKDTAVLEKEWKDFIAAIPLQGPEARFKRGYRAVIQGGMFPNGDLANAEEIFKENVKLALADLDSAIDGGIADPRAWWARSKIQGNREAARKDLTKAIELDPLNPAFRYDMGLSYVSPNIVVFSSGDMDVTIEEEKEQTVADCPEAKPFLGLATELAPDNDLYRARFQRYMGAGSK